MPKRPTAEDAEIIMRLYDLRREAELRKARAWFAGWWPRSADEIVQIINAPANPQETPGSAKSAGIGRWRHRLSCVAL
jgi:hypothetical protein